MTDRFQYTPGPASGASMGKAAGLAGLPVGKMIALLSECGVKSNLRKEDTSKGWRT
jgi:hypothetical protein